VLQIVALVLLRAFARLSCVTLSGSFDRVLGHCWDTGPRGASTEAPEMTRGQHVYASGRDAQLARKAKDLLGLPLHADVADCTQLDPAQHRGTDGTAAQRAD
jgi:hypothetical protein